MSGIKFDSDRVNRYFIGKYSEKEESYIKDIFKDDHQEHVLKGYLSKQFEDLLPDSDMENKNLDQILYKIHYDINTRLSEIKTSKFENIIKWSQRIAVIIVLPLLIFIGLKTVKDSSLKKDYWVEIVAPAWTRAQFSLPDGTMGWLNSNSSIKYNGTFTSDRQVFLKGEAFFDVFKDQRRPFNVNTNELTVRALGTSFNIASYENENFVEVVLKEGKLLIVDKELYKSYTANPNDLIIFNKSRKEFSSQVVQTQKYLSWTEGKLVFRNDPLDIIARKLERWYNVEVEINGNLQEDLRLRATFIDEDIEEVLGLLKRSLHIDYRIVNGNIKPDEIYAKKKVIIIINPK